MDFDEIVVHHVKRHRIGVVLNLFRETIGQAGKPPHVHPNGEVLPLHIRRADMLHIRVAFNSLLLRSCAIGGAVAAFGTLRRSAINID